MNLNNRKSFNILSGNKPLPQKPSNGHNIWPGRTSSNHEHSEAENEPPNGNPLPPGPIDIFQEREGAGGMRVGRDFQAKIPPLIPVTERNVQAENDRALLVWCPSDRITGEQIENYLEVARDKYQYSGEQALGLLYWHRYEVSKALQDLGNFTPHPEEWTLEDKVLFEQAFQFHGKAFDRIRQMLPDKSMSSLIRYYYKWKKFKTKSSVMDRQVKKMNQDEGDESATIIMPNNNNHGQVSIMQGNNNFQAYVNLEKSRKVGSGISDSEGDDKFNGESGKFCSNCGIPCTDLHSKDNMCNTCFLYWKKTGEYRPLTGPLRRGDRQVLGALRPRRFPPKGMYINHDDLSNLASSPPQAENVTLQGLEKDVLDMKCRVQVMKQEIEILKKGVPPEGMEALKPNEGTSSGSGSSRVNSRWTQDEITLATLGPESVLSSNGMRRYGRDFQKMADVIGTKTEAHLKSFYVNYRKKFSLDDLIKEYESENADELGIENAET